MTRRAALALLLLALAAVACDPAAPLDDASAAPDAGAACTDDEACDDRDFCDGVESCDPSDPDADPRGCVEAAAGPCTAGRSCDEETDSCRTCAGDADADGDGHDAIACEGDDCDDSDRERFPGNPEVCDADGHDEDCSDATYGARDADADGSDDASCCNGTTCGDDCDDGASSIHPGASESCNVRDDDCDGASDEGLATSAYAPDCDGDGFGSRLVAPRVLCGPPSEAPCGSGGAWSTMPTDCDDTLPSRSPVATESCNGGDDDCDGTTDEASAAASCALAFGAAEMACELSTCVVASCVDGRGDCDGLARNGCEIDLASNAMHCDACGALCVIADATAICRDGACAIGTCNSGFHACGSACARSSDVATCGTSCTPCPAGPTGSHTTCDGTRCGWECDAGRILTGGACSVGPRPIWPPSGSIVSTRRPIFRWELGSGQTGSRVEICADRACAAVLATLDFTGSSGTPSSDLPAGLVFYRHRGISGASVATAGSVAWEIVLPRAGASTGMGTAWGSIFDPNGDGRPDVAVAPGVGPGMPEVAIFDGVAGGVSSTVSRRIARPSDAPAGVSFAYSVAAIGDVNGDGYVDVAVGTAPSGVPVALPLYVYHGGAGGLSAAPALTLSSPLGGMSGFGLYAYSAGDIDRDGYSDLVVGDPRFGGSSPGWVHAFRGGPDGLSPIAAWSVMGTSRDFGMGVSVADYDCDGRADVVASSPLASLRPLQVYYARGAFLPLGASHELFPVGSGSSGLGGTLDAIGDPIGDGCIDLVGSFTNTGGTIVWAIWPGSPSGFHGTGMQGATLNNVGGNPVTGARYGGDVDGDGLDEVIAVSSTNVAATFDGLSFGSATSTATLAGFASDLASIGDVDRDGFADVAITGAGTWIYRGRATGIPPAASTTLSPGGRDVD